VRTRRFWNVVIAFALMAGALGGCGGDGSHDSIIYSGSGDAVPADAE